MANSDVDEIKQRLNIVDLVSQYVTLKKSGVNHKGLCPFHQEKSPSFMVNGDRQIYKCFGCNEGGDAFDFVMKLEGLTFPEALQLLADRAGVVLQQRATDRRAEGQRDEKSRLYRVNQFAARYFAEVLHKAAAAEVARAYLAQRTVTDQSITAFQLGYAPNPNRLAELLRAKGVTATELGRAGNPERFRTRIIFPLTDPMGNVVGFTGRLISEDGGQNSEDRFVGPKYLNTPETALFKKSRTLYGLTQAKQAMRKAGYAIVVEGQMDVILSHQAGVLEAIASSGTALTEEHLRMVRRYVPTVRFAFDADEAGFKAAERSIFTALDGGLTVELIALPDGVKDVGELVEHDPAAWVARSKQSQPVVDWLLGELTRRLGHPTTAATKKAFAKEVLPYLKRLTDPIEQAHYVAELARRLRVTESVIRTALARIVKPTTSNAQPPSNVQRSTFNVQLSLAEQLVVMLVQHPSELKRATEQLDYTELATESDRNLFKVLESCYTQLSQRASFDSKAVLKCMEPLLEPAQRERLDRALLSRDTLPPTNATDNVRAVVELIGRLKGSKREQLKQEFASRIADAEASGDRQAVKRLMVEFQGLLVKGGTSTDLPTDERG